MYSLYKEKYNPKVIENTLTWWPKVTTKPFERS